MKFSAKLLCKYTIMVNNAVTEKRTPTYDLKAFKHAFSTAGSLTATGTALMSALELGFGRQGIVDVIQTMSGKHFYKSMTSFVSHHLWQDVYHVPSSAGALYVKFQADAVTTFLLLSFKER
jgi:motility quorum-sensing regulator/GCU-specific mRNA interferase toxin